MRRLPPLRALRVFEVVARHASVTRAAEELAVSHSAVSQQIKQLEDYFGQPLFMRSGRGISPTPGATAFLEDVRSCFDRLAIASEQLSHRTYGRVLKIDATPSFALRWLIPQISAFQLANPSIELRISTSATDGIGHLNEPVDFVVRRDVMSRPDHVCQRFLDDVSTVVLSPTLLKQKRIASPEDMLEVAAPAFEVAARRMDTVVQDHPRGNTRSSRRTVLRSLLPVAPGRDQRPWCGDRALRTDQGRPRCRAARRALSATQVGRAWFPRPLQRGHRERPCWPGLPRMVAEAGFRSGMTELPSFGVFATVRRPPDRGVCTRNALSTHAMLLHRSSESRSGQIGTLIIGRPESVRIA